VQAYSQLLLTLYRAAREMPAHEFPDFALGMVKSLIPFDSARLVTVEMAGKSAIVQGAHLHNEPDDMVLDWEQISRYDTVLETVVAYPGKALSYHAPSFFNGPGRAVMLDYSRLYGHQNGLVVALFDSARRYGDGLSLYRTCLDDSYSEQQQRLIEYLMPHMIEALDINQLVAAPAIRSRPQAMDQGSLAIARIDGTVHHCGPGFMKLMRLEWPQWRAKRLPDALFKALGRAGAAGFTGARVVIIVECAGELLFLRAHRIAPLERLSPREREVACLYGAGKSYKEIARTMHLAPTTVRNFLQRIYQKLQISDKAELAAMLIRSERE
jgi:DNA-binding CsgD family transcriptional regulator